MQDDDNNSLTAARAPASSSGCRACCSKPSRGATTRDAEAANAQPAASAGREFEQETYHLYEFDGTNFTLEQPEVVTCGNSPSINPLPNGQALLGDRSASIPRPARPGSELGGRPYNRCRRRCRRSSTYTITGTRFNGLSQAADFGDEFATPTNYPLVRITNSASGHVFYARDA